MNCMRLLTGLVLLAAPLIAQQPAKRDTMRPGMMGPHPMMQDPMMSPMSQMMGPMMRVMAFTPDHLLARGKALGLSGKQVGRLTQLRDAAKSAHDAAMAIANAHMRRLEQAADVAAPPDTAALKTHFQAAHTAMGRAHWAMLSAAVEAKGLLSAAQRAKVQAWVDSMQVWMQQHQQMMGRPQSQ